MGTRSTGSLCLLSFFPSAFSWMTPSSWWKTSSVITGFRKAKADRFQRLPWRRLTKSEIRPSWQPWPVIAAILPMAFVSGLMGPYMRPIPVGASAAMVFSLMVAFLVTPWATLRLLNPETEAAHSQEGRSTKAYRRVMSALINNPRSERVFSSPSSSCFLASLSLFAFKAVRVKMLPLTTRASSR